MSGSGVPLPLEPLAIWSAVRGASNFEARQRSCGASAEDVGLQAQEYAAHYCSWANAKGQRSERQSNQPEPNRQASKPASQQA